MLPKKTRRGKGGQGETGQLEFNRRLGVGVSGSECGWLSLPGHSVQKESRRMDRHRLFLRRLGKRKAGILFLRKPDRLGWVDMLFLRRPGIPYYETWML